MMDKFECTSCGLCCKQVGAILTSPVPFMWMKQAVKDFPYKPREDGSCEKLGKDNRCSVYADRPLLCNIERMADEIDMPINKETWYEMNYIGCRQLQMEIKQ
jgi:Fe-S-cluster containining protein